MLKLMQRMAYLCQLRLRMILHNISIAVLKFIFKQIIEIITDPIQYTFNFFYRNDTPNWQSICSMRPIFRNVSKATYSRRVKSGLIFRVLHWYETIVHFIRLGSRVFHDSFIQYVFFFSKQCTYCKTNAIYTWGNFIRFLERRFLNLFHEYRNVNGTL